jgi:hypothetical protein
MDTSYGYKPISENNFRILTILSVKPELSTSLREHSMLDPPDYCALSYAWTHEPLTASINCDGKMLPVTPDLFEALQCISTVSGCQSLWVDAICINQLDQDEKSHHVFNMHRIYRKAVEVYIWLGPWQYDSHLAMNDITSISDRFEDVDLDALHLNSDVLAFADWRPGQTKFHPVQLFFLIGRPWFRRLWTYQEVLLARKATFFCGYEKKDLNSFLEFAKLMLDTGFLTYFRKGDPHIPLGNLEQIRHARKARERFGVYNIAHEALRTLTRQVTEPFDRVYALFGMAEDTIYHSEISVDYSPRTQTAVSDLYVKFGKLVLREENMLMLLYYNSSNERMEALPSWCPNFNSSHRTSILSTEYAAGWPAQDHQCADLTSGCKTDSRQRHAAFKELLGSYAKVSFSSDIIRVWGAQVDTVADVGDVYPGPPAGGYPEEGSGPILKAMLSWLDNNLELCKTYCTQPHDVLYETYWRTQVGNIGFNQKDFPCDSKQEENFRAFRNFVNGLDTGEFAEDWPLASNLANHLDWIWRNRRLFVTVNGRIGFGSDHVTSGDVVCALYSGPCLFVLRKNPNQETYTFKEAAYAHGLMQGEVFDLLDGGEATEELFAIE